MFMTGCYFVCHKEKNDPGVNILSNKVLTVNFYLDSCWTNKVNVSINSWTSSQ